MYLRKLEEKENGKLVWRIQTYEWHFKKLTQLVSQGYFFIFCACL